MSLFRDPDSRCRTGLIGGSSGSRHTEVIPWDSPVRAWNHMEFCCPQSRRVLASVGMDGRDLVELEIPASFETFLPAPGRPFSLTGGRPRLFTSQLRDPRAVSFFTFLGDGYFLSPIVKPQSVDRDRRSITPRSWRLYNVPRAKGNRPVQYHIEMESQDNFLPCPRTDPCFSATVHELLFQDGGASSAWNTSRTCPLVISSMWGTDATPLQS